MEGEFNGEAADSSITVPSRLSKDKDFMSIDIKRRVEEGHSVLDDTEPLAKKARLHEVKGKRVVKVEVEAEPECVKKDSETALIKTEIDQINGEGSTTVDGSFATTGNCCEDTEVPSIKLQRDTNTLVSVVSERRVDVNGVGEPADPEKSSEVTKIKMKDSVAAKNAIKLESPHAEVSASKDHLKGLESDLEMLAAAAEKRQMDLKQDISKNLISSQGQGPALRGEKRKSRKQNMPRRITYVSEDQFMCEESRKQNRQKQMSGELSEYFDNDHEFDEDIVSKFNKSSKDMTDDVDGCIKTEKIDRDVETYYTDQSNKTAEFDEPNISSGGNFSFENIMGTPILHPFTQGSEVSPSVLQLTPFHNEMLATLSQSLYQNTETSQGTGQKGISDIEENLDVVRKLREIRFYKYRKISVAEKQEIAAYAKQHSVSAAAAQYGVSKSAVSMWTRTDFSDMKDDIKKRKRNCMLGNEKFEQLLERVKQEKGNKFKGLTKQDKFEVSRYAKLVGVREMARCLGIALGTVSGWMRQFPYNIKPVGQDDESSGASMDGKFVCEDGDSLSESFNASTYDTEHSYNYCLDGSPDAGIKLENEESLSCDDNDRSKLLNAERNKSCIKGELTNQIKLKMKKETIEETETQVKDFEQVKSKYFPSSCGDPWDDDTNSKTSAETVPYEENDETNDSQDTESNSEDISEERKFEDDEMDSTQLDSLDKADEVDEMIAETLMTPDIDQCYENIKEQIRDTSLENDQFFEALFRRVLSCRTDKYKSLKASEKLEVVRYAKRIGVRKVAKLLGLATGTLSGWNTKYQAHLGLTMDLNLSQGAGTDSNQSTELGQDSEAQGNSLQTGFTNVLSADASSTFITSTPKSSSLLDNAERSEVTAIRFLLKEQFPILQEKIAVARQIKFRNIKPAEKIEIVKCAKLVGIRPTARVLGMPIGTLSGWITKYTNTLHPVYHIDNPENQEQATSSVQDVANYASSVSSLYSTNMVNGNVSFLTIPQPTIVPVMPDMTMMPVSVGLVSGLPNNFSQTFFSSLHTVGNQAGESDKIVKE